MENQTTEYKEVWNDDNLKCLCAFANTQGGTLIIGKNDRGDIVGVKNSKKLLEDIPNKIRSVLGIMASVDLKIQNDKEYIEIKVKHYKSPITCNGRYYKRVGSTTQELNGAELDEFLFNVYGETWEGLPAPNIRIDDLENSAFRVFRDKAVANEKLSKIEANVSNAALLANLKLTSGEELANAGVLLFHHDPEIVSFGAYVKIAYFTSDADFKFQDEVKCPVIEMPDKVLDLVYAKYFKGIVSYSGLQRIERFPIPREAFREALLNAIIHKDYRVQNPIQIRIYDNKVIIYNAGQLPKNWTIEKLSKEHESCPHNPLIAGAFFRAGYIEAWGRGIDRINTALREHGLKDVEYSFDGSAMKTVLYANLPANSAVNDPINDPINDPLKLILAIIVKNKNSTYASIAKELSISPATAKRAIAELKSKNIIQRVGSNKTGYWEVR